MMHDSGFYDTPFEHFLAWYEVALTLKDTLPYPNAMTVTTLRKDGFPDSRILLLKEVCEGSFVFFTNYNSSKGQQLQQHPKASLNFYWQRLGYQIRIVGTVKKTDPKTSEQYFQSRPRMSQLGAWASQQSQPMSTRTELEDAVAVLSQQYPEYIPCPPYWGGYALTPVEFEFWVEGKNRLHDRYGYVFSKGIWQQTLLYP